MRSHTSISLRQAKASLSWLVKQVEKGRSFVITKDGAPSVAVVPRAVLEAHDAKSTKRAKKVAALLRQLHALMPGASS